MEIDKNKKKTYIDKLGISFSAGILIALLLIMCVFNITNAYVTRSSSCIDAKEKTFLNGKHFDKFYQDMQISDAFKLTPLMPGLNTSLEICHDYSASGSSIIKRKIAISDMQGNRMKLIFMNRKLMLKSFVYSIKNKSTLSYP